MPKWNNEKKPVQHPKLNYMAAETVVILRINIDDRQKE
jgi:hypothetical protein